MTLRIPITKETRNLYLNWVYEQRISASWDYEKYNKFLLLTLEAEDMIVFRMTFGL